MTVVKGILGCLWCVVFTAEFSVWLMTVCYLGWTGAAIFVLFALVSVFLFGSEGLELAAARLLGRVTRPKSKRVIAELARLGADKTHNFFQDRQAFVPLPIVLLTIASSFRFLYVPGVGEISDERILAIFVTSFPTLSVLYLAQIPGKILAIRQPERFFAAFWPIVVAARWIGATAVTAPAKLVTLALAKLLHYEAQAPESNFDLVYDSIDGRWLLVSRNLG